MWRRWTRWLLRPLSLGERGERAAEKYLRRSGLRIVERRARRRIGEIDLVAVDPNGQAGRTLVLVEVKTRTSHAEGHPTEAVDERKQRRLSRVALAYLKGHGLLSVPARFDVVAVTWPIRSRQPKIEHYVNAFEIRGGSFYG